ncbi:MAG TPA: molybdopterin-dependent oxidoreductase [Actinomycetes bacterium]|nr:molybdopterin-dependent oxidoreductase [Actinomycetes bacterium]
MGRSIRLVVVALVTALAVAACGGGGEEEAAPKAATPSPSTPQVVDDGSLAVGEKIAAPKGEVVLTVTGDIGAANKGSRLELDLASLEQMRRVRLEAAEPFLKRRVMFEGVLLSDLLAMAGVPDSASKISVTALDDYKVEFKLADVRSSQMLLATRADGKHMPVDRSGPIRIVFPDGSSLGRNPDLWIWSVSSMKVA